MRGEHAQPDAWTRATVRTPLALSEGQIGRMPLTPPFSTVVRPSVRAFNALYYGRAPRKRRAVSSSR